MAPQDTIASDVRSAPLRHAAGESLEKAREATKDLYLRGKERVVAWEENVEDRIRERPMRSILIAAGVGAAVGVVLGVALARR